MEEKHRGIPKHLNYFNQLMQLSMASTVWPGPVVKFVSVRSVKSTAQMMTNEKQRKTELKYLFLQNYKRWTDYKSLTKTGLSTNIDRPCNKKLYYRDFRHVKNQEPGQSDCRSCLSVKLPFTTFTTYRSIDATGSVDCLFENQG